MGATLLCGARVITMSSRWPEPERLSILVEDDRIAAVCARLSAPGASVVDLTGRVVIPGLVNAHLHTWQTALRSLGADWALGEYLTRIHDVTARRFSPDDVHIGTLAGALSQINSGTTTLGDWSNNVPTPTHTDAAVDALGRSGIRAVYLHGGPRRAPDLAHGLGEVDRLLARGASATPLLTVGLAITGPQASTPEVALADFRAGEERGIVVSMHQSGGEPAPAWSAVRAAGLFGPRTNIVHGAGLTDDWISSLVDAAVSFTATPENELNQGHGTPITGRLLRHGAAPSLGTDVETVVAGDLLTAARFALAHQRNLDHERRRQTTGEPARTNTITSRQALAWATIEGARALGLTDQVGRIEPGMQADLVAIDTRSLNLSPSHDAIATALRATPGEIEAVMIAGRWRKRDHRLVDIDLDTITSRLRESSERLFAEPERRRA